MTEIKKLDVMSWGKTLAGVMALLGFIIAIVGVVITLIGIGAILSYPGAGILGGAMFGTGILISILLLIGLPILYGISGFITGVVVAWLYNFVASKIGGVKIEFS